MEGATGKALWDELAPMRDELGTYTEALLDLAPPLGGCTRHEPKNILYRISYLTKNSGRFDAKFGSQIADMDDFESNRRKQSCRRRSSLPLLSRLFSCALRVHTIVAAQSAQHGNVNDELFTKTMGGHH